MRVTQLASLTTVWIASLHSTSSRILSSEGYNIHPPRRHDDTTRHDTTRRAPKRYDTCDRDSAHGTTATPSTTHHDPSRRHHDHHDAKRRTAPHRSTNHPSYSLTRSLRFPHQTEKLSKPFRPPFTTRPSCTFGSTLLAFLFERLTCPVQTPRGKGLRWYIDEHQRGVEIFRHSRGTTR